MIEILLGGLTIFLGICFLWTSLDFICYMFKPEIEIFQPPKIIWEIGIFEWTILFWIILLSVFYMIGCIILRR